MSEQPVAPVEAKEKERRYPTGGDPKDFCVCGHHEMCHAGYSDLPRSCNQTGCICTNYAPEPKPTPSTPATEGSDFDLRKQALWEAAGIAETMWREDDNRWNRCVRQYRDNIQQLVNAKPQPDSSSISTEQTFEDVLRNRAGEYQDMGREHRKNEEYVAACCCEDKASGLYVAIKLYRSWNAAKGQSNGR